MFFEIKRQNGSMLITAVFVMVVFGVISAVIARMITEDRQNYLNSVMEIQAELLAESGLEYAMTEIFPLNRESSLSVYSGKGSYFYEAIKDDLKNTGKADFDFIGNSSDMSFCTSESSGKNDFFCRDMYSGCYLSSLKVTAEDITYGHKTGITIKTTAPIEYTIRSVALCEVPFLDAGDNDSGASKQYLIRREKEITASDIRVRTNTL